MAAAAQGKRDLFASRLGVLAATLGSAVGLGNIWKVPALTGQHGGASFLLIYVLSTLVVALPLMIVEMIMGRRTRANAYKTFVMLTPPRPGLSGMSGASARIWRITGGLSVLAAALILAFYSDVAGWVFAYVPKAVSGGVATTDPQAAARIFGDLLANPWESLLWQWLVLGCIAAVIMRGASAGIERVTRVLIPLLFLLLVAVCIRSLTLPNAQAGLRFLFMPDFARIDGDVVLMAMGLSFFKMSIGFGCMITYGSYFQADTHVPALALRVMVCDLLVSLLAGVAVFPAVFSFGFEPTAGTSLLFLTIPAVFASMPGGQFFTALFFVLSAVAATGAMLCLLEIPVAWLLETCKLPRPRATLLVTLGVAALGVPPTLSTGIWSSWTVFGLSFFDAYDFATSNLLLPVCGLLTSLFAGYVWPEREFVAALTNSGNLPLQGLARLLRRACRTLTPLLIVIILLHGLKVF
ncbi:sodium-dependent transporter [Desulfovibrio sp. PG-178-WT-4]|uniref:Sodium-dependent transporter n=1 Tax=Desulfovibrio porci TaxID=2605782 RepID=A0A6L5XIK7_9BACT|nr:sodium-dependent transporter [Desulfovibrio porci]MSS27023.1 sodium-dependent transporter [Desulfovibrio porci]